MTLSSIQDHCKLLLALLLSGCSHPAAPPPAATLTVAAAADLQFALADLAGHFHDAIISPVYGSSGNFYAQIRNGAPFDVFLSADMDYPRRLAAEGFALPDSLFVYGAGRIVVWVPAQSPFDLARLGMDSLESASIRHIAIANPQHAPYGRAAEAALRHFGLYDRLVPKLVLGENIAQTFEFVETGAAEAGIVALSLALAPQVRNQGRYYEIPLDSYPRLEQGGVILARARSSAAAAAFRVFLLSPAGRGVLKQYGFYLPEP